MSTYILPLPKPYLPSSKTLSINGCGSNPAGIMSEDFARGTVNTKVTGEVCCHSEDRDSRIYRTTGYCPFNYLLCRNLHAQCLEELKSREFYVAVEQANSTPSRRHSMVESHLESAHFTCSQTPL